MQLYQAIPAEDERERLLDALTELLARAGWEHFVTAPILLPTREFFPDLWTPDEAGVLTLTSRLLAYASMDHFGVTIELFDQIDGGPIQVHPSEHRIHREGAAAWFAGIEDGVCSFGVDVRSLDDPIGITAAMAHECGHAFRAARELVVDDGDIEELLTDLTTVYLGFGVLTTNGAARHRSWTTDGELAGTTWSFQSVGYLSPQALAFLLAVQLRVRNVGLRPVARHLETNQAASLRPADAWLRRHVPDLRQRLGIPEPSRWPESPTLASVLRPLRAPVPTLTEAAPELEDAHEPPAGVSRVPFPRLHGGLGMMATILLALTLIISTSMLEGPWPLAGVAATVVLFWLGRRLGRRYPRWECSECRTSVGSTTPRCHGCGGRFVRDLAHERDRLED